MYVNEVCLYKVSFSWETFHLYFFGLLNVCDPSVLTVTHDRSVNFWVVNEKKNFFSYLMLMFELFWYIFFLFSYSEVRNNANAGHVVVVHVCTFLVECTVLGWFLSRGQALLSRSRLLLRSPECSTQRRGRGPQRQALLLWPCVPQAWRLLHRF